jgi:hypothetical protein
MTRRIVSTVGQIITLVLPQGTNDTAPPDTLARKLAKDGVHPEWVFAPQIATDLFAVAAYLCRIGGVVGFFDPSPYAGPDAAPHFFLTREDRDELDTIAWTWRGGKRGGRPGHPHRRKSRKHSPGAPKSVQDLWSALLDSWDRAGELRLLRKRQWQIRTGALVARGLQACSHRRHGRRQALRPVPRSGSVAPAWAI